MPMRDHPHLLPDPGQTTEALTSHPDRTRPADPVHSSRIRTVAAYPHPQGAGTNPAHRQDPHQDRTTTPHHPGAATPVDSRYRISPSRAVPPETSKPLGRHPQENSRAEPYRPDPPGRTAPRRRDGHKHHHDGAMNRTSSARTGGSPHRTAGRTGPRNRGRWPDRHSRTVRDDRALTSSSRPWTSADGRVRARAPAGSVPMDPNGPHRNRIDPIPSAPSRRIPVVTTRTSSAA